uniref:Carbamoyl phosphate synthase small chain n=1 Tax=Liagoropsis maxima TaxID=1653392 RepID=A0A1G4NW03_9FLOR|nr:Carbamoyl phosphate synthase small subunit [Liagoropsis maxima]SCW22696.1 Carbamoyl phosphate synthase small subunit [Liagoropsis maxima]
MFNNEVKKAILVLEDKTTYYGWSFSKLNNTMAIGEVVFNTGMTGYQEIMTDPSYSGQIVTFTYPELGNTGINNDDNESAKPSLKGIIAKNLCLNANNWRARQSLIEYLQEYNIANIYGIDTRALTKHLRKMGTMKGCISTECSEMSKITQLLEKHTNMIGYDLVQSVSTSNSYKLPNIKEYTPQYIYKQREKIFQKYNLSIIVIDFGVKTNILRNLSNYTDNINVVPADTSIKNIMKYKPDGILLSNGPGDPAAVTYAINNVKELMKYKIPIFGICMGHQILSLALGLKSFKLKFGHRGLNHPVGHNKHINITSQNHGFAITIEQLVKDDLLVSQTNYNDNTVAAISHRKYPYFAVQYHPEASPGPHDTMEIFGHFIRIILITKAYPSLIK